MVFPRVLWAPGFRKLMEIFPACPPPLLLRGVLSSCQLLSLVDLNKDYEATLFLVRFCCVFVCVCMCEWTCAHVCASMVTFQNRERGGGGITCPINFDIVIIQMAPKLFLEIGVRLCAFGVGRSFWTVAPFRQGCLP